MTTEQESPARDMPEPNRQAEEKEQEHRPSYITNIGGHVHVGDSPCGCSVPWDLFDEELAEEKNG